MKDRIIDCLAYNGKVSIKCISSAEIVEKARKIHDLSPTASAALGRLLTITSIMGYELKSDEATVTNQIKGEGPIGMLTAVSDKNGNVKGYVSNPQIDLPLKENGKLDVGKAVGTKGMLYIVKDLGVGNPYVGMTPIVSGEIAEDFTHYFALSEQTPSVVSLGVLTTETTVEQAGGLIVQLMPDATEETIATLEQNVAKLKSVTTMLSEGMTPDDILNVVLEGLDPKILDICDVKFDCNCSKERIKKVLISLGRETLTEIIEEDKQAEISCHFCNSAYHYTEEELREILAEM